jgi:hypothetical protein
MLLVVIKTAESFLLIKKRSGKKKIICFPAKAEDVIAEEGVVNPSVASGKCSSFL